ncbi:MAG: hypothetical protein PWP64_821 [Candidatus Cloacimonadota bacterium]|jgi:hypothetical protein|nr:hypothetical protein [Candidatus Cloacimonadota bacterium]
MQVIIGLLSSVPLFWVLLSLFIILNIVDGISTYLVMKPDHYKRERNPIARFVFRKLGIPKGIIIFKTVLLSILIPAMGFYAGHDVFTINIVLAISNLVFFFVVIHNYRVYHKIKKWSIV